MSGGLSRPLLVAMLLLCAGPPPAAGQEPLRVDITQGKASALLVAVADTAGGTLPDGGGDAGLALSRIMRADLETTGRYRLIALDAPLAADRDPPFDAIRRSGAQSLVVGRVSAIGDDRLSYDCALYDVFGGQVQASRRLTVPLGQWRRAAHQCADIVFTFTTGDPGHFDTRIVYVAESGGKAGRTTRLAVMDYDGANGSDLTKGGELVAMPRFSPDGRRLLFMAYADAAPKLVVADLTSGDSRTLDLPPGIAFAARFSPDGRSAVFSLARDGDSDIYRIDLAGGAITRLTDTVGADTSPGYSPDGSQILFESDRSGRQQIYIMAADGSGQRRISFGAGAYGSPVWSPRGDLVAFTHIGDDGLRIGVMRPDGSHERLLTAGRRDESPSWAPSGRALAFQRSAAGDATPQVWTTDLTGTVQRPITAAAAGSSPDWSGTRP